MLERGRIFLFLISLVAVVNSATNGFDSSMMNTFLIMPQYTDYFKLNTSTEALNVAIINVGGFLGFLYSGWLVDRFGRKLGMAWGASVTILGVILQSAAVAEAMFVIGRFLIGNGMTITAVAAPTYVAEVAHPMHRGVGTSIYNSAWYVGSLVVAAVSIGTAKLSGTWSWRSTSILQVIPSLLCLAFLIVIPESPRWLVYRDRHDEAFEILVKYHGNGDRDSSVVQAEFREIQETLKYEKENQGLRWKTLISTPGNRMRTWINVSTAILSQFIGSNIASYYLSTILTDAGYTDEHTQLVINTMLQFFNLCCAVAGTLLVDKLGRRPLFLISTSFMAVFMTLLGILTRYFANSTNASASKAIVACVFLFMGGYSFAWTPLSVLYPVEILNYPMRAKGMALNSGCIYASAFINTYIIPYALNTTRGWIFYICTGIGIDGIALLIVYFFYKETKGKTLEELNELFDGTMHADVPNVIDVIKAEKQDDFEKAAITVEEKNVAYL